MVVSRILTASSASGQLISTHLDEATHVIQKWQAKNINPLPALEELPGILDRPLPEDERVPISAFRIQSLISTEVAGDICNVEDVESLFRTAMEYGESFLDTLFFAAAKPPPTEGTESSFIHFWDSNVREVLQLIIPEGKSTRDSSLHTATRSLRPDYAFLLHKLCPFRGEEKGPGSKDNPKKELSDKLAWAYDPAPYVLGEAMFFRWLQLRISLIITSTGYYAVGPELTLVAISPPPQREGLPVVHNLATADLRYRRDRIKNICRLINLSGLLRTIADLVRPPDAEFVELERLLVLFVLSLRRFLSWIYPRDHSVVEIAGHTIIKSYAKPEDLWRVAHLKNIYALLKEKHVPYVDSLVHNYDSTFILSPRGLAEQPRTEKELLEALTCVLEALIVSTYWIKGIKY